MLKKKAMTHFDTSIFIILFYDALSCTYSPNYYCNFNKSSIMAELRYTNEDILNLFIIYGQCDKNISRTCRRFNENYPDLQPMNNKKFLRLQTNFINFGTALKEQRIMPKPILNQDNKINTLAYFEAHPRSSIRGAEQDLGVSRTSIQRILSEHKWHDFKYSKVQALIPEDFPKRLNFCEIILVHLQEDPNFLGKIIWTDESKFSREGLVNRKNQHFWANENPHAIREAGFQQKFSFNVFCLLMDNQLRYIVYDDNLNSARYLNILRTVVEDFLENLPIAEYRNRWYQLDGAPAHSTAAVAAELTRLFEDRWFGLIGPWNWPPRSPDLTPLDFYLWPTIKDIVYKTPVNSREELENRVIEAFQNLDCRQIRASTTVAVESRINKCLEVNGQQFEQLLK